VDSATEISHLWPQFLPDGRHFLYWLQARDPDHEKSAVIVASVDDKANSKERRRLLPGDSMGLYSSGHLLFEREGALMAQAFDTRGLQLRGDPLPIVQQLARLLPLYGWSAFSASFGGTLVYQTSSSAKRQLAWFDRSGKEVGRLGQPEDQLIPRLSSDQKRVAVARRDGQGQLDIWLVELARDTSTRFTFGPRPILNSVPIWSPDSDRIVFNSNRDGVWNLYQKASNGAGSEEPILKSSESKLPTDWHTTGALSSSRLSPPRPDMISGLYG
jgi:hypothetical protein